MPLGPGAAQAVEARPPRFLRVPRSLRSRVWYVCPAPLQPGPSTQSEKPTRPSTSQDIGDKDLWFRYISVRPYTTPRHWVPLPESPSYPIMISCPRLPWGSPGLPPLTTWSTSAFPAQSLMPKPITMLSRTKRTPKNLTHLPSEATGIHNIYIYFFVLLNVGTSLSAYFT